MFAYGTVYRVLEPVPSRFGRATFHRDDLLVFEAKTYSAYDDFHVVTFLEWPGGCPRTWDTEVYGADERARFEEHAPADPLVSSATVGDLEAVRVRCEALRHDPTQALWTRLALRPAIEAGHADIVAALLEAPSLDATTRTLMLGLAAGSSPNAAVVQAFIDAGVPLVADDPNRQTPLHHAAARGCLAVVRLLVDAGLDPLCGAGGSTPLQLAESWKRAPAVLDALRGVPSAR